MTAGRRRDEGGQVLIMALAFILLVAALLAAVLSLISTNLSATDRLRKVRDDQYATDGAMEWAIGYLRTAPPGFACDGASHPLGVTPPTPLPALSITARCTAGPPGTAQVRHVDLAVSSGRTGTATVEYTDDTAPGTHPPVHGVTATVLAWNAR